MSGKVQPDQRFTRRKPDGVKRTVVSFRVPEKDLAIIRAGAEQCGLSLTEYVIRCCIGEPLAPADTDERLDDVERRLDRLENLAFGGS